MVGSLRKRRKRECFHILQSEQWATFFPLYFATRPLPSTSAGGADSPNTGCTVIYYTTTDPTSSLRSILTLDTSISVCARSLKMGSSIGSDAFSLLALAVISIFVLLLLRHFLPLRTTPAYLVVPVFLALALPISMFLLVPIDLASSSGIPDTAARGIWLPDGVLLVAWRVAYWLTFALTWRVQAPARPSTYIDVRTGSYFLY